MSVNLNVENLVGDSGSDKINLSRAEKVELYEIQEKLSKKFESLYKNYYVFSSIIRLCWFALAFILTYLLTYLTIKPEKISEFTIATFICSAITMGFAIISTTFYARKHSIYQDLIKMLERRIVSEKINENFYNDEKLKGQVEDFYIQLHYLLRGRYDIYFKSIYYEFVTYTAITIMLTGYLFFKVLR